MELAKVAFRETGIEAQRIFTAVWTREKIMGTAIGSSIAVPHARLIEISAPVVVAGISREGIDFNAIDGVPARLIFMLLTPTRDEGAQLQILAISRGSFQIASRDQPPCAQGTSNRLRK